MSEPVPENVYTLTNQYMPGLVKIGRSTNIDQRIADLSRPTGVPGKFVLEFAKSVTNSSEKERQLHSILSDKRVEGSEFFKATPEEVRALFALMEGDWITPAGVTAEVTARAVPAKAAPVRAAPVRVTAGAAPVRVTAGAAPARVTAEVAHAPKKQKQWTKKPHPELHQILEDGQQVYHKIKKGTEWTATFSSELNKIVYNGTAYTLNQLATTHYKQEDPGRKPDCNAWVEIKTLVNGQMISLEKLEPKVLSV
jgi:hypothetical protein